MGKFNVSDINLDETSTANLMINANKKRKTTNKEEMPQFKVKGSRKTKRLNVLVTDDIYNRLKNQADINDINITDIVTQMLEYCLSELEK